MVDFLDSQNVNDRDGDVDLDRDDCLQHLVKAEWGDLLVVVVLARRKI